MTVVLGRFSRLDDPARLARWFTSAEAASVAVLEVLPAGRRQLGKTKMRLSRWSWESSVGDTEKLELLIRVPSGVPLNQIFQEHPWDPRKPSPRTKRADDLTKFEQEIREAIANPCFFGLSFQRPGHREPLLLSYMSIAPFQDARRLIFTPIPETLEECERLARRISALESHYSRGPTANAIYSPVAGRVVSSTTEEVVVYLPRDGDHRVYAPFDSILKSVLVEKPSVSELFEPRNIFRVNEEHDARVLLSFQSVNDCMPAFVVDVWIEVGSKWTVNQVVFTRKSGARLKRGEIVGELSKGSLAGIELPKDASIIFRSSQIPRADLVNYRKVEAHPNLWPAVSSGAQTRIATVPCWLRLGDTERGTIIAGILRIKRERVLADCGQPRQPRRQLALEAANG